ncbi:OmpH family outer membrane protein [Gallibacterium trehalosifermentans]|uniref:OmpH family outer membrane protein n=1 Tax=Gallibacterium trehalosifermentans TaxID=516935 RepID=A0ABV6H0K0_9PAST
MKKALKVTGLAIALASTTLFSSMASAEENIAYVNGNLLLNSSNIQQKIAKIQDEYKAAEAELVKKLEPKRKEIEDKRKKLEKDSKNLRQADIKKREEEIQKLIAAHDNEVYQLQQKYNELVAEEQDRTIKSIQGLIAQVAKEKKYTFVLTDTAFAYADSSKDITEQVIELLKKEAVSEKK